jgi:tetratricopeptide (TPR) repeat protein
MSERRSEKNDLPPPEAAVAAVESHMGEFRGDFAFLIETGFIAVKQLDETCATRLFQAAQALSPDSTAPQVGLGFIALNKLEVNRAISIFEKVIEKEPDNYLAHTFLGICCLLNKAKRRKGEKIIQEAMEKTTDETVKELGKTSLEWAERDLKREDPPFFVPTEEKEGEK